MKTLKTEKTKILILGIGNVLMGDEGEERVKKTYGGNYERLAAIKKKYDPDNFFRVNQNIKPS